mgnify:CR=1 FL=1
MDLWRWIEYGAWALAALLGIYMIVDWLRIDRTYPEDVLTSSQEGEIEAIAERHKVSEVRHG